MVLVVFLNFELLIYFGWNNRSFQGAYVWHNLYQKEKSIPIIHPSICRENHSKCREYGGGIARKSLFPGSVSWLRVKPRLWRVFLPQKHGRWVLCPERESSWIQEMSFWGKLQGLGCRDLKIRRDVEEAGACVRPVAGGKFLTPGTHMMWRMRITSKWSFGQSSSLCSVKPHGWYRSHKVCRTGLEKGREKRVSHIWVAVGQRRGPGQLWWERWSEVRSGEPAAEWLWECKSLGIHMCFVGSTGLLRNTQSECLGPKGWGELSVLLGSTVLGYITLYLTW